MVRFQLGSSDNFSNSHARRGTYPEVDSELELYVDLSEKTGGTSVVLGTASGSLQTSPDQKHFELIFFLY